MRILQVFNRYLQVGGEERSVRRIARHLELGGHDVERFWRESSEWGGESAPARWRQALWLGENGPVLDQLAERHRTFRPDIWLLHNVVPVVSLGIYRRALDLEVPVLQWLHNYRPISPSGLHSEGSYWSEVRRGAWQGSRVRSALLAFHYRRVWRRGDFEAVKAWVAVSATMRSIFEDRGFFPQRLATIRHAWDLRDPARRPQDSYYLFLGRLTEEKGVRFLVELFSRPELRAVGLKIAGLGPLRAELEPRCTENIEWIGFVDGEEKRDWIRGCQAILFPSLWEEPLSTVAYEAYEQERPIFTSDRGGMQEIVLDQMTGRLLPAGEPAAWIRAILDGPEQHWGLQGRAWVEKEATPKRWNEEFAHVVREFVGRVRSG